MRTTRLGTPLEVLTRESGLRELARSLLDEKLSVCVDFSSMRPTGEVGGGGTREIPAHGGLLSDLARRIGLKRARYFTCLLGDTLSPLDIAAEEARLSRGFRMRAFEDRPDSAKLFEWDTSRFWQAGDGHDEESGAALVLATVDDGTAVVIRGDDSRVRTAEALLQAP